MLRRLGPARRDLPVYGPVPQVAASPAALSRSLQSLRQVAVVVEKFIGEGAAVPKELGYRRVVAVGDLGGVPVEKQLHQHPPQDGAVTEDGDGFLRVPGGGRFHAPDEAGGIFMEALGALQLPGDRVPAEAGDGFGFYPLQVAEGQILPTGPGGLPECGVPMTRAERFGR